MPQSQSSDKGRPGRPDLADFRGREPAPAKPGELPDQVADPPVSEDDASRGEHQPQQRGSERADARGAGEGDQPSAPERQMSPGDQQRARIAERFSKNRDTILAGKPPEDDGGEENFERLAGPDDADDGGADDGAARKPGEEPAEPETITLAVNGKTITKTRAEVLALSGMTEDEYAAKPDLAKRFAQKELATSENLERSKQPREIPSRADAAARAATDDDTGDDDADRPTTEGDTSLADIEALVNDIQISDPKEVAPKLKSLFETVARQAATSTVEETEGQRRHRSELMDNANALKSFLDDHKEIGEVDPTAIRAVSAAVATGLDELYREDLRSILISEGESEASADAILSSVSVSEIRSAHLRRRASGHPKARRIDKGLIETVYGKVQKAFGVPGSASQQRDPQRASRAERKAGLQPQPRSAAAPAQAPAQARSGDVPNRRATVAQMATRTGRKARVVTQGRASLPAFRKSPSK
jgi:hypothetical protein